MIAKQIFGKKRGIKKTIILETNPQIKQIKMRVRVKKRNRIDMRK